MLTDLERKVLSIMHNYMHTHGRRPTMTRLEIMTGRRQQAILHAINKLAEKQFIKWDGQRIETVVVLQAREDDYIYRRRRRGRG